MSTKAALKSIRSHLQPDPGAAAAEARALLEQEPENYNAGDADKCKNIIDHYVSFVRKNGSRPEYKNALLLQLPTSPYYHFLEGAVPDPNHTFTRVIEIAEAEEKDFINREIGERRTRIGATIDRVVIEVKREAFQKSQLDDLYRNAVNWISDDETRYNYEEKLLQRAYDYLSVLPSEEKLAKRKEVIKLAQDMVIIKHPYELAWNITLEWQDFEEIAHMDVNILRGYIKFFSDSGLAKVLRGYLKSGICPFTHLDKDFEDSTERANESDEPQPPENDPDTDLSQDHGDETIANDQLLLLMAEGLEQCPNSILAHRIMSEMYLSLQEWESVADVCRKAINLSTQLISETGLDYQETVDALNIMLAKSLIHHQSPRHHPEARTIFESILDRKPTLPSCLLGLGVILIEDHDYITAVNFLDKAMKRDPDNLNVRSEHYWSRAHNGELETALNGLQETLEIMRSTRSTNQELKAELLYRIGYCQWGMDPSVAARKDRTRAYASFLASIQASMNYAPAYTSLGLYYADYKKDAKRARRCFHKAFELSSAEIEAAERLARDFADQKDWAIVEAVAERVVSSGRAKPAPGSKRKGCAWPYAALGVVEMNRQQYPKAIVNFQSALRIEPGFYEAWVGLAESYHHSGRYGAATRAFEHAETLEGKLSPLQAQQTWYTKYMLANVKRVIGDYDDAIARYEAVARLKPHEFGVSIAMIQALTENARKCVDLGLFGEAAKKAADAIVQGVKVSREHRNVFNLWKAIGDAYSVFSWIKGEVTFMPIDEFKTLVLESDDDKAFEPLSDIDNIGLSFANLLCKPDAGDSLSRNQPLYAAILAYKRAVMSSSTDVYAQAVAWYNLGWAEHRAYVCEEDEAAMGMKRSKRFLKASMRCFKRAIELEAGNPEFWNALGVVTTHMNPKVAQHSFVRSLHLSDNNAPVWTNLGTLYLLHNDYELASAAFTRAQSADPDYPHAWLALGLLSLLSGEIEEARLHFTHALEIGTSAHAFLQRHYATSVFDHMISQPSQFCDIQQIIQPLFAVHKLHILTPQDLPHEHLLALLSERIGDTKYSSTILDSVCSSIEAQYELSESLRDLYRFAQANADAARAQLANQDNAAAVERADAALTISSEEGAEGVDPDGWRMLRLSAHVTAGLAYYYLGDMDKAIEMFKDALEETDYAPQVVCLLAQVLWAKGGEEERDVAREQLLNCVQDFPHDVSALTLLTVIALLDSDYDALDAVQVDLQELRIRSDITDCDRLKISKLLVSIADIRSPNVPPTDPQHIEESVRSIVLAPYEPQGWIQLTNKTSDPYAARVALENTMHRLTPRGSLVASNLAKSYALLETRENAARAVMIAPWVSDGWKAFAHSISTLVKQEAMQRPQSVQTYFLDQPPSCLEFCPTAPDYLVIGTYLLTEEKSSADDVTRQFKTGSVQLWRLDTASNSLSQVQKLSTPDAVFDLQFSLHDPAIFATATSAGNVALYQITTSSSATDGVKLSQLQTFSVRNGCTIPALYLAWIPPLSKPESSPIDGFAVSFSDGSVSIFHPRQLARALSDVEYFEDLEELRLPNDSTPIEVWYIAFDKVSSSLSQQQQQQQFLNLYAGDDFGALRCHQLTCLDGSADKYSMSTFPAQVRQTTTDRGRFHTAGVTAVILPFRDE
ncbi:Superkiller protein 3 [Ascosphaera aggregata]|nr:Superkiller protein 3 [Ascosphaera aggregata]